MATSRSNMARLRGGDIGAISAWLPPRRALDGLARPGAVGQVNRFERRVPMARHAAGLLNDGGYRRICTIARHCCLASFAVSLLGLDGGQRTCLGPATREPASI